MQEGDPVRGNRPKSEPGAPSRGEPEKTDGQLAKITVSLKESDFPKLGMVEKIQAEGYFVSSVDYARIHYGAAGRRSDVCEISTTQFTPESLT